MRMLEETEKNILYIGLHHRIRLRPRILRDVSVSDTRTTVQGTEISFPVGIAPTAFHCLAWHEGEVATARGEDGVYECVNMSRHFPEVEEITLAASTIISFF